MRRQRRRAVIMLAGLMNAFLGTNIGYSAGIIHLGLLEKHKKSPNVVFWAGALFSSLLCLAGPISSVAVNALSCRSTIFLGSFLSFVGFMVSSFVSSIEIVVFSYGIVAGLGQSMIYSGTVLATGFHFHDNPSVATGVVVAGAGMGVAVFPMFTEFLIETYGIDGTFLLLSAVSLQVVVFNMCIETHELENNRKETSMTFKMKVELIFQELRKIFSMGAYLQFCISIFCWSTSVNTSVLLLPQYYVSTGSSHTEAAILMSLYGITGCFSRILTGLAASDPRVDGKLLYMGSYIILGLSTFFLPLIGNYFPGKVFYSLMLGIYSSNVWSLLTPITIEIVGIQQMPTAFGMELLIGGIGFLIGPIIGGKIQRETEDFTIIFIISGFLYVLAGIFEMLMILTMTKSESFQNRNNMEKTVEVEEKLISNNVIEVKQLHD